MTFQIVKPALVPARGLDMIKPVESLTQAMHLIARTVGDPLQSAVRLGELTELGLLKLDVDKNLVVGDGVWTTRSAMYRGLFTANNRSMIQTSVPNGGTFLDIVPNGTALSSYFTARGSVGTGFQYLQMGMDTGVPILRFGHIADSSNPGWFDVMNASTRLWRWNADGSTHGLYAFTVGQLEAGTGFVVLNRGSAPNPGYIAFHAADATRRGFIGWNTGASSMQVVAEGGWTYTFNSLVRFDSDIRVAGAVYSDGTGAALYSYDRTTGRQWAWYGTSDIFRLFNGGGDLLLVTGGGNFCPASDGVAGCGLPSNRWATVYAATGTINTSDGRDKTSVVPFTANELAAAKLLAKEVGMYQWLAMVAEKGAELARVHCGMTVQRAIEVMESCGLDPMRYGFICYDSWPEKELITEEVPPVEAEYDSEGMLVVTARDGYTKIIQEAQTGGDRYSFRMDELMMFIARGFEARLSALEEA